MYTAWFACEPECGWTLAYSAPKSFGDVDELAAAVVALARVAFGVLVGEDAALRREHGGARVVLRGDQLDAFFLAAEFRLDGGPERGVALGDGVVVVEH